MSIWPIIYSILKWHSHRHVLGLPLGITTSPLHGHRTGLCHPSMCKKEFRAPCWCILNLEHHRFPLWLRPGNALGFFRDDYRSESNTAQTPTEPAVSGVKRFSCAFNLIAIACSRRSQASIFPVAHNHRTAFLLGASWRNFLSNHRRIAMWIGLLEWGDAWHVQQELITIEF